MLTSEKGGGKDGEGKDAREKAQGEWVFPFAAYLYVNDPVEEAMQGGEEVIRLINTVEKADGVSKEAIVDDGGTGNFKREKNKARKGDDKTDEHTGKEAEKALGALASHKNQTAKPKEIATEINDNKFLNERDLGVDRQSE